MRRLPAAGWRIIGPIDSPRGGADAPDSSCRCSVLGRASIAGAQARYYPDRFDWHRLTPEQSGMNASAVDAAVKFATGQVAYPAPKDLALLLCREPGCWGAVRHTDWPPQAADVG